MSLPSGYKRLEYIQSNGAQYIDTGVAGSSEMRVVCTISNWPKTATDTTIFGCRSSGSGSDKFQIVCTGTGVYRSDYYNSNVNLTDMASIGDTPVTIDKNKNVTTFSNTTTSYTNTSGTFTSKYNIYVFALNTAGTAHVFTSGVKLYSARIYSSGNLVRDFIPCKNASGAVGLWDDANSVFYQNAGTGSFTAGPEISSAGSVLIGGTAYSVTGGRTLINGTGYAVSKGRTLIDGTGYDIAFGAAGTPLSDFTPGVS